MRPTSTRLPIFARTIAMTAGLVALAPFSVQAHPHVFIDAGLEMHFDTADGRLTAISVVWVYDEFYSMLLIEDLGLDPEFAGTVSEEERAQLQGFDMNWVEGYEGDLYLQIGDQSLELLGPQNWTTDYRDGRIISTHVRPLAEPQAVGGEVPLVVKVYDPTYYVSYTIATPPLFTGRDDCAARIIAPDLSDASDELDAALAELQDLDQDVEAEFPAIGAAFSEETRVRCASSF